MDFIECAVRDGNRVYRFLGTKLAEVSSQRPGVARWSELALYRTSGGDFFLQKIGRSQYAHREDCDFVDYRMPAWIDATEETAVHRIACPTCQPVVGDAMDPHTRLEPQRYTVLRATTFPEVTEMLVAGRARVPQLIQRLLTEAATRLA